MLMVPQMPPAAGALPSSGPIPSNAPLTENDEMNAWVASLQLSVETDQALRELAAAPRLRVLMVLAAKMGQTQIQNPSSYLHGIIRKEAKGPYWQPGPVQSAFPSQSPPASLLSQLQRVATPQQTVQLSPRTGSKPPWVQEAWCLAARPAALMKKMYEVLGQETMQALSCFPLQVQVSMLTALVLSPAGWADPTGFVKSMIALTADFPPLPSGKPPPRAGKGIVVLQLGVTVGAEYVCLKSAIEQCKADKTDDLRVDARLALVTNAADAKFHTQLSSSVSVSGGVELHTTSAAFAQAIAQKLPEWKTANVTFIVLVTLPMQDSSKTAGPVAGPQWHIPPANSVWKIWDALRPLAGSPDNRYAYIVVEPVPLTGASSPMLDEVFGAAWVVPKQRTKVPTCEWRVRCWPALSDLQLPERKVDPSPLDAKFHRALVEFQANAGHSKVSLPTPEDFDSYLETAAMEAGGDRSLSKLPNSELLRSYGSEAEAHSGSSGQLLDRSQLARLWGVDGWNIDVSYNQVAPCLGTCCWSTGFLPIAGSYDGIKCGEGRWCIECDNWYSLLHRTAPPHVWNLLPALLREHLRQQAPSGRDDFAKLAVHSCNGTGCGCY
jgi:hypothetical protein